MSASALPLPQGRSDLARRFGPLMGLAVALMLVSTVLPSALNLPQSNPTTTPEYAPVPPQDSDEIATDPGNVSNAFGLGSSDIFGAAPPAFDPVSGSGSPDQAAPGAVGKSPRTKLCVGRPPRQTEDPLSPPCVAYFDGDNGGATATGVSRSEVVVLFYLCGGCGYGNGDTGYTDRYVDLAVPATDPAAEPVMLRVLRAWQRYFNHRYQTYNRNIHFWAYFNKPMPNSPNGSVITPERGRADAADNYSRVRPFAIQAGPYLNGTGLEGYYTEMNRRGAVNFLGAGNRRAAAFQRYPGRSWGYDPTVELRAEFFASYVCEKVVKPGLVTFAGDPAMKGRPRRLGLLHPAGNYPPPSAGTHAEAEYYAGVIRSRIEACGGVFVDTQTLGGYVGTQAGDPEGAASAVASFRSNDVTTVIWTQGWERNVSQNAANLRYFPEWVLAGDGLQESNFAASQHEQSVWRHAVVVTIQTATKFTGAVDQRQCRQAYLETNPDATDASQEPGYGCGFYSGLRQMFTGIQVAGPKLTVRTMDQGFHAIPAVESKDPAVPACFYLANDYTCVKDAMAEHWDPDGRDPGSPTTPGRGTPGCWRMTEGGLRHVAGRWPPGDVIVKQRADDPCNGYTAAPTA